MPFDVYANYVRKAVEEYSGNISWHMVSSINMTLIGFTSLQEFALTFLLKRDGLQVEQKNYPYEFQEVKMICSSNIWNVNHNHVGTVGNILLCKKAEDGLHYYCKTGQSGTAEIIISQNDHGTRVSSKVNDFDKWTSGNNARYSNYFKILEWMTYNKIGKDGFDGPI
ncbi:hypothetical protein Glove_166g105 [Diversispora epigaea]|uniref:Uncharacterized protein n=1 Tax=Diversispora epigaea TaxID=1348612 RepID=A0A397ITD8_9GLOM|nr:hypothetical protein Glove_166g105 [Diversispora epigaea]